MGAIEDAHSFAIQLRESADDGSDFSNADADYRIVYLGEDGYLHAKDSAGAISDPYDVSSSGLATGTSFPGGPTTGDRFRRSDLAYKVYFYDGTRWLTEQMFTFQDNVYLVTVDSFSVWALNNDFQLYLVDWDILTYVSSATTWVATLQTIDTENDVISTLDSVSTASNNSAEFYNDTKALGVVVNATGAHSANRLTVLRVFWDEQAGTSSFIGAATIRYRIIGT